MRSAIRTVLATGLLWAAGAACPGAEWNVSVDWAFPVPSKPGSLIELAFNQYTDSHDIDSEEGPLETTLHVVAHFRDGSSAVVYSMEIWVGRDAHSHSGSFSGNHPLGTWYEAVASGSKEYTNDGGYDETWSFSVSAGNNGGRGPTIESTSVPTTILSRALFYKGVRATKEGKIRYGTYHFP